MNTIKKVLEELNYNIFTKVLNSSAFGLPQNRERLYIVAFFKTIDSNNFEFPRLSNIPICLSDVLEKNICDVKIVKRNDIRIYKNFTIDKDIFGELNLPNKPIQIGIVNKGGQGERIYHPLGHAITLSAYGGGVGAKTGLYLIDNQVRKLSPRECARIQGFPDSFLFHENINQAYKQFGNSVSINVLQNIILQVLKVLKKS